MGVIGCHDTTIVMTGESEDVLVLWLECPTLKHAIQVFVWALFSTKKVVWNNHGDCYLQGGTCILSSSKPMDAFASWLCHPPSCISSCGSGGGCSMTVAPDISIWECSGDEWRAIGEASGEKVWEWCGELYLPLLFWSRICMNIWGSWFSLSCSTPCIVSNISVVMRWICSSNSCDSSFLSSSWLVSILVGKSLGCWWRWYTWEEDSWRTARWVWRIS